MQEKTNLLRNFDKIISSNESNKFVENSLWDALYMEKQAWLNVKSTIVKINQNRMH